MLDMASMLAEGLRSHRAGELDRAACTYRAVLAIDADEPRALYLYGLLLLTGPDAAAAEALLARSAVRRPHHAESRLALANARHARGDGKAAEGLWRDVLIIEPGHVAATLNLANHYCARGDIQPACDVTRAAIELHPKHAGLWLALAKTLLAGALHPAALIAADAAIELDASSAEAWLTRGIALNVLKHDEAARTALTHALALRPDCARAELSLGNALIDDDRLREAEPHLQRAIALDPRLPEAHTSLGFLSASFGRLPEALASHDRAVALRPNFAEAHSNRAATLLLGGDLARGFAAYEWRKRDPRHAHAYWSSDRPVWQGEALTGRTILIFCEQGLGDTIMCARFLPVLAARGASIVLVCAPPLIRLLAGTPGVIALVARSEPQSGKRLATGTVVPYYDIWIDQMSLPAALGVVLDDIPGAQGYLKADPALRDTWAARLPPAPLTGVVWAGNPEHSNDRRRSIPRAVIEPLLALPHVQFVSLQLHASDLPPGVYDAAPTLHDLAETAACVAGLNLVITVDTAVAHLAAALGRPTWLLLPYAAEWRWLLQRSDSPWYSSMRLFRQASPGDWRGVINTVIAELQAVRSSAAYTSRPRD